MTEKIPSQIDLNKKEVEAQEKISQGKALIAEGEAELSGVQKEGDKNMDVYVREASMDYTAKLEEDLLKAVKTKDMEKTKTIIADMESHQEAMKVYAEKARVDIESYFDKKTGEVDLEKLKQGLDAFMKETLVVWYGEKDAEKAKIVGTTADLSKLNYEELLKDNKKLFGNFTINAESFEKKEPKAKILNEELKEFVGKSKSEVMEYVVKTYGDKYYVPGLEYEKYLIENPDKIPEEMKDGNWYYFMGSVLRGQVGESGVPCVRWGGSSLNRDARWLRGEWDGNERVVLLEK